MEEINNQIKSNPENFGKPNKGHYLRRILILICIDSSMISIAYLGAFLLRYPGEFLSWMDSAVSYLPVVIASGIIAFGSVRMYRTLWRYASIDAMIIIFYGTLLAVLASVVALVVIGKFVPHWSIFITQWMILFLSIGASRFSIRFIRLMGQSRHSSTRRRILIYGAGDAGEMISRDTQQKATGHDIKLVGFIDDDAVKKSLNIHGAPIFGGREVVRDVVDKNNVEEIVVAMPTLDGRQMREIITFLQKEFNGSVKLRTVPGVAELIDGKATYEQLRSIDISDLLRRKPIELDISRVEKLLKGKSVLVSGAGGSIGSEICRQAAICQPEKLVLFDISEPNLYLILDELTVTFPQLQIKPIVGDISHRQLTEKVFATYDPAVVFHAAAYKHVPLMEQNPRSAIRNNIVGTSVLADVAAAHGVEKFVMISTDKAVRPTSMMGATKRICEMLVKAQKHEQGSVFSVVRFGNVMGSSGSVIPKFERQIKNQGLVTVTDPEVTRFFMLTSEAVQLVLQAATLNEDDAIYILDMGEPVKIFDLARDMIRLSGLKPDIDVKIEFTGLRDGEKLYEELYHVGVGKKTAIEKIWVTNGPNIIEEEDLASDLNDLLENCYSMTREELYASVARLVPDFKPYHKRTPEAKHEPSGNGSKPVSKIISVEEKTVQIAV